MSALLLDAFTESDYSQLREAMQRLLTGGAVLREDTRDLYDWAILRRETIVRFAEIIGLKVHFEPAERLIFAVPESPRLLRRLRQDETLVALALWYDFDIAVKNEGVGTEDVCFPVQRFNEQFQSKFKNIDLSDSRTRLQEILRLLERKSLVRLEGTAGAFADWIIHVLPTIRFIIPFQDIEDWKRTHARHADVPQPAPASEEPAEEDTLI